MQLERKNSYRVNGTYANNTQHFQHAGGTSNKVDQKGQICHYNTQGRNNGQHSGSTGSEQVDLDAYYFITTHYHETLAAKQLCKYFIMSLSTVKTVNLLHCTFYISTYNSHKPCTTLSMYSYYSNTTHFSPTGHHHVWRLQRKPTVPL